MKRESGFTLIELMVSMAVLLVVVGATLSLFQYAMRTNESSTQLSNMNGNLRSAMNLITRDLIQAGQGIPTGGVPLPEGAGCTAMNRPVPVGTSTFTYGCPNPASNPNLPSVIPGNGVGPIVPDTPPATPGNLGSPILTWVPSPGPTSDIITFFYQDNTLITNSILNGPIATPNFLTSLTATSMTFSGAVTVNSGSNTANIGDIFLVSGAGLSRYVAITSVSGQTLNFVNGDVYNLNQQGHAASGTISDLSTAGVPFGGTCTYAAGPPATFTNTTANACSAYAQRVLMISYWLDITQSVNGQVIPRLMRQVGMASSCASPPPPVGCPRSVAEVIEGFELSYDYVNGTTPVNNQVSSTAAAATCSCTITDNQIRKVNVYMAGRSDTQLSQNQQYLRTNLATQIDLRSLAFVDRYR